MDGRPGCACAPRTAATAHAGRSAEAAAAEDFDPLRIRPYVVLPNGAPPPADGVATDAGADGDADAHSHAGADGDADRTTRLGATAPPTVGPVAAAVTAQGAAGGSADGGTAPGSDSVGAGTAAMPYPAHRSFSPGRPAAGARRRRRRRLAVLTIGAATAAVIATAAFASTLFADDATPKQALPDAVDTGVPYSGADTASAVPSASAPHTRKPAPSRSASASAPVAPSPSPSGTSSASRAAAPGPSKSAPAAPPPSASPRSSRAPEGKPLAPPPSQPLRRGDSGPGVLELQERLGQLGLYTGSIDGTFGSRTERSVRDFQSYLGVSGDPAGVYGPQTRSALESVTDRP
ncbi:peptidoglycan-binding domain-containing protein [Streptomyces sp. NPDC006632]|uniref:peptidoglycan-binding domain-containing protein n=1 Tax=Streptomyces sp. NPDC006632 TaxID=3157182 RepID=UPI0033ADFDC2